MRWKSGEPSAGGEDCAAIFATGAEQGQLYNIPCTRTLPFLCQHEIGYSFSILSQKINTLFLLNQ